MNDPLLTRVEVNMWNKRAGNLQYFLLVLLFAGLIGLDHVPKHTAHVLVWYWAITMVVILIISAFCSMKSHRLTMLFFEQDMQRIKEMTNGQKTTKTTIR